MKLDRHYHISDEMVQEIAKKTKKEIYKWLWELPIYKGIYIEIRKSKINELVDGFKEINKANKSLNKAVKEVINDFKPVEPKITKSKPSGDTGGNAKDHSERPDNKEGED